jgi:hypothetical protein
MIAASPSGRATLRLNLARRDGFAGDLVTLQLSA